MLNSRRGAVGALLLLATLLLPTAVLAHQRLLGTYPERDSTVGEVPAELRLVFLEPVQLAFTTLRLVGADGSAVELGPARLHPDSAMVVIAPVAGRLAAGSYSVEWSTASRDGHPVRGSFAFSVADGADGLSADHAMHESGETGASVAAPGQPGPAPAHHGPAAAADDYAADAPTYVAVRWLTYLGILGVLGSVAFRLLVLGSLRRRVPTTSAAYTDGAARRAAAIGAGAAVFTAAAALARLYAQSRAMHGAELALDAERVLMIVQQTIWGWGWILQLGAATLAAVALLSVRRAEHPFAATAGWATAAVAALALALTPALSGHAAAMTGSLGTLMIVNHALHVIAAGGWLGSLFLLLTAGLAAAWRDAPGKAAETVSQLVQAFSPTALIFAGLLVGSGVFSAVVHIGSLAALTDSRYGNLLLLKLGIFVLVTGTGAYNFLRVRPALGSDAATGRLTRTSVGELVVGAGVLLVTAVLVATARPYDAEPLASPTPAPSTAASPSVPTQPVPAPRSAGQ